jgi:hypothetical protein
MKCTVSSSEMETSSTNADGEGQEIEVSWETFFKGAVPL